MMWDCIYLLSEKRNAQNLTWTNMINLFMAVPLSLQLLLANGTLLTNLANLFHCYGT